MKRPNILILILAIMVVLNTIFVARLCADVKTDMVVITEKVNLLSERVGDLEERVLALEAHTNG